MLSKLSDLSDVVLEGYDDDDDDVVLREEREGKRKQLQQQQQHGFTTLEEELSDGGGTIEMRLLLNGFGIVFTLLFTNFDQEMSLELLTSVDFLGLLGHNQKRALNAACLCMYACITCLDHHWSEPAVTQYCDELVAQFSALFSATAKSQDEHLPVGIMTAVRVAVLVGEKSPILERIFPEFLSFLLSFQSSTKIDVVNAAKACLLSLESQFVPSLNDTAEAVGGTLETLLATLGRTTEWHGVVMLLNLLHQFFNRFKFIVNGEQVEKLHLTAKKNLYHPIISVATSAAGLLSWLL
jgi:hypothetical protein